MNRVIQKDLEQRFDIDPNGTVVETRKITNTDGTITTHQYRLDRSGLQPGVQFDPGISPQASVIQGTLTVGFRPSQTYNRCIVVALGTKGTKGAKGDYFIFYNVWLPEGDGAAGAGNKWLGWNSGANNSFSHPVLATEFTVDSPEARKIVITGDLANPPKRHRWIGTWSHGPKPHSDSIAWT
jgi:hypothetical protein